VFKFFQTLHNLFYETFSLKINVLNNTLECYSKLAGRDLVPPIQNLSELIVLWGRGLKKC